MTVEPMEKEGRAESMKGAAAEDAGAAEGVEGTNEGVGAAVPAEKETLLALLLVLVLLLLLPVLPTLNRGTVLDERKEGGGNEGTAAAAVGAAVAVAEPKEAAGVDVLVADAEKGRGLAALAGSLGWPQNQEPSEISAEVTAPNTPPSLLAFLTLGMAASSEEFTEVVPLVEPPVLPALPEPVLREPFLVPPPPAVALLLASTAPALKRMDEDD